MSDNSIYADIAKRTDGDIYIGVVGPVRTGKSTFIRRFLDTVVIPNIDNIYDKERTLDEVPQSASGRTIMTTEPKFVPDESVRVCPGEGIEFDVKMVDCVGYMVDGALGAVEDGSARMVMTPWSDEAMPFVEAAELGTSKVIGEHATIAMLVTTDGTISDIPRESYIAPEERVVRELREAGKPFAIILNSADPNSDAAHELAHELENKYNAPVALVCCPTLDAEDIREILALVLGEFPVKQMTFNLPDWTAALPDDHKLKARVVDAVSVFSEKIAKLGDIEKMMPTGGVFERVSINAGDGTAEFNVPVPKEEYYKILSEMCGTVIKDERALFSLLCELTETHNKYKRVEKALSDVESKGYGIVMPSAEELKLEEPEIVKQNGGYGVRLSASAQSIHMIRANIETEINPIVGTEQQSEELVRSMLKEFESEPSRLWNSNMFGKTLYELVNEGLHTKLEHIPDESRTKLSETLERIVNEGSNGLICIIL